MTYILPHILAQIEPGLGPDGARSRWWHLPTDIAVALGIALQSALGTLLFGMLLEHLLIRVFIVADEAREFGKRIVIRRGRLGRRLPQATFELVKIDDWSLSGDGITHHFHLETAARSRPMGLLATLPLFPSPRP
jgi:hypothetical protein